MKTKANYTVLDNVLADKDFDEKYALLSHYIQLQDSTEKSIYECQLKKNGIDLASIKSKEDFNTEHNVPFPNKDAKFSFIDLFAGIGGFRLAMQNNGGKCVFSSEWDDAAKQTYFENYGEVPFGDITKEYTKSLIPEYFDVLCAGFPCQPFSNAGKKKGIEDTRGTLFYEIADIVKTHMPKVILLENVRGLISNAGGNTLQTVLRTITHLGYMCNIPQEIIDGGTTNEIKILSSKMVLCAKDYGVPQNRPRIYIVLWRRDINIDTFKYPAPLAIKTKVGDILETNVSDTYTISDRLWEGHQRRRKENAEKGKGFGYCSFTADSQYTSTISRRYYKDGSEILILQDGKNPRKITPREASRLQGFPDDFRLHESKTEAYKQAGNSVAVPVVNLIAEEIRKQILER